MAATSEHSKCSAWHNKHVSNALEQNRNAAARNETNTTSKDTRAMLHYICIHIHCKGQQVNCTQSTTIIANKCCCSYAELGVAGQSLQ